MRGNKIVTFIYKLNNVFVYNYSLMFIGESFQEDSRCDGRV